MVTGEGVIDWLRENEKFDYDDEVNKYKGNLKNEIDSAGKESELDRVKIDKTQVSAQAKTKLASDWRYDSASKAIDAYNKEKYDYADISYEKYRRLEEIKREVKVKRFKAEGVRKGGTPETRIERDRFFREIKVARTEEDIEDIRSRVYASDLLEARHKEQLGKMVLEAQRSIQEKFKEDLRW